MHLELKLGHEGAPTEHDLWVVRSGSTVAVEVDGETLDLEVERRDDGTLVVHFEDGPVVVEFIADDHARIDGHDTTFRLLSFGAGGAPGAHGTAAQGANIVHPPMPGKIVRVDVAEGDTIEAGQTIAVLEAMKMQSAITAPRDGTIVRLGVAAGDAVDARDVVCEIGDDASS